MSFKFTELSFIAFYVAFFLLEVVFSSDFLAEFDHETAMDESEQFWIGWTPLNETHIEFGLEVNATGWIVSYISTEKTKIL